MTHAPLAPFIGERSPRILVVDDQKANLELMCSYLELWGCMVRTATSGAEGLLAVKVFNPDAILLDIMMPGLTGFEVSEALQADPATRHIPVIFLTALVDRKSKVTGFASGGADYITKPFDAAELAARLGARLRQKLTEDQLRHQQADLTAQTLRDPLTGLPTQAGFRQTAALVLAEAAHAGRVVSLVVVDIDDLQAVNTRQGRAEGDRVLRAVAGRLAEAARDSDVLGREGDDEFAWLLSGADGREAVALADDLRSRVEVSATVSLGGATVSPTGPDLAAALEQLRMEAGKALAAAKEAGGNRVVWRETTSRAG